MHAARMPSSDLPCMQLTGEIVMKERKRGRSPDPAVAVKRKRSSQEAALAKFLLLCETGETAGKSPSRYKSVLLLDLF